MQYFTTATCNSLSLSASSTDATCNGGSDGSIDLTATGASGSYTYSWDNGSTSEDPTGLSAGTYVVTVTDSWGCTSTLSVVVGEATAIVTNNPQSFCPGGSYTINGNTYTSAGTYTACTEVIDPVFVEAILSCKTPISSARVGWYPTADGIRPRRAEHSVPARV